MEFKICQNIDECKLLWDKFSPKKRLFDIWGFRECFYDPGEHKPYFIVGYEGGKAVGIVPLHFVKSTKQYNYFGGWFPERNSFLLKDKTRIAEFLEQCPKNTFIEGIDPEEGNYYNFLDDEFTYYLDLSRYSYNFENYFSNFDKKKQKNLKREIKNMPPYQVYYNRIRDFDRLVELNLKQYEEDSKLNDKAIKRGVYKLAKLAQKQGALEMISLAINGRIEAVDIGIKFGEWYYTLIGGTNNQKIPNLGKLMMILDIKNAIAKNSRFVDFSALSGYWKDQWNLDKEMLLKFVK